VNDQQEMVCSESSCLLHDAALRNFYLVGKSSEFTWSFQFLSALLLADLLDFSSGSCLVPGCGCSFGLKFDTLASGALCCIAHN
jgi:hypothetical protein